MTRALLPALAAAVGAALLLSGCSSSGTPATPTAAPSTPGTAVATPTADPSVAAAASSEAAAEAAADPAAATDPRSAALATALRAGDLPAGWHVEANPVLDGDLSDNPSLAGICGGTFTSEARRTAKFPVVGLDPQDAAGVTTESIAYDADDGAALALSELRTAFGGCPPEQYPFVPPPAADGLAPDNLVVEYQLGGTTPQLVVAQVRGPVLTILISDEPDTGMAAARSIATRLAALPASL